MMSGDGDRSPYVQGVSGQLRLDPLSWCAARIGSLGMRLRVPGAAWLFFWGVLPPGVKFETKTIEIPDDQLSPAVRAALGIDRDAG